MVTEKELEEKLPIIDWREPLLLRLTNDVEPWLCCRFCIAFYGLKAHDVGVTVDYATRNRAEFDEHMRKRHE